MVVSAVEVADVVDVTVVDDVIPVVAVPVVVCLLYTSDAADE